MNAERFNQGDTYAQFIAKLPPEAVSGYRLSDRRAEAAVRGFTPGFPERPVAVACVAESWCLDTRVNLPLAGVLARQRPWFSLRIFSREQAAGLNAGRIPTLIFYDRAFRELGRWVERPATAARLLSTAAGEAKKALTRDYVAGKYHPETLQAIRSLLAGDLILHITARREWERARAAGFYESPSLTAEGFIHCSTPGQVLAVADAQFHGRPDLVLLCIDPGRVHAALCYEDRGGYGEDYPHLYGRLNLDAVDRVLDFPPDGDGRFRLPALLGPAGRGTRREPRWRSQKP